MDEYEQNNGADPSGQDLGGARLSEADAAAVDRLMSGGFDPAVVDESPVGRLLGLLGTPLGIEDPALVDVTLLRCERASDEPELCPADQEALAALALVEYDSSRVVKSLRPRAERLSRLRLLATADLGGAMGNEHAMRGDLVERTMALVQRDIDEQNELMRLRPKRSGISNLRWMDLISVAAVLLIMSAVAMPMLSGMRASSAQVACASNMQATGNAMGMYAGANRAALPVASAGFGGSWMDVGTTPERSNSANLYTLVHDHYARLADLACAGNRRAPTVVSDPEATDWKSLDQVSYSYQIVTRFHPVWRVSAEGRPFVILADRSPVVLRAAAGEAVQPFENSPNHAHRGQHILANDGSSKWIESPVHVSGDNIWLPRGIELVIDELRARNGMVRILGTELPDTPDDVFLGP